MTVSLGSLVYAKLAPDKLFNDKPVHAKLFNGKLAYSKRIYDKLSL